MKLVIHLSVALFFFIVTLSSAFSQGDSPALLQGQHQTSKTVGSVINVPNYQATKVTSSKALIETGNKNILENPSFEHSTYSTGWTTSNCSPSLEQGSVLNGSKAYFATCSGQTLSTKQYSTLYQANFADGVQGLASIYAKATVSGFFVCAGKASNPDLSNCVAVNGDSKWAHYKVPFILGATDNGISIVSGTQTDGLVTTGNITGDIYLDDAYVGVIDAVQSSSPVGPWTSFTPTGSWTANTTYTGKYRQVGSSLEIKYAWATSGAPTSATLTLDIPSGYTVNTNSLPSSASTIQLGSGRVNDTGTAAYNISIAFNTSTPTTVTVQQLNAAGTYTTPASVTQALPFTWGNTDSGEVSFSIPVNELNGNVNTYTASCGANCLDELTARVDSAGTVTAENSEWITGDAAVTDTSLYTFTIPSGIFPSASPICEVTAIRNGIEVPIPYIVTNTATSLAVRLYRGDTMAKSAFGFGVSCRKSGADFVATRTIVGSFKEVNTSPGISRPKTCVYSFGGSASTLASPVVFSTGTAVEMEDTCNAISPPSYAATALAQNLTIANGTYANSTSLSCSCEAYTTTAGSQRKCALYKDTSDDTVLTNSSGGAVLNLAAFDMAGTAGNSYFKLRCTGEAP